MSLFTTSNMNGFGVPNWFDIPFLLEDAKKETSPKVLKLYQEISNARDFSIY